MSDFGCDVFSELSPELALGTLDGDARARAVTHLQHCDVCRHELARQSVVVDELVALTPAAEPPAGFETRVLAALPSGPRRRVRVVVALVAAVMAGALALSGWAIGRSSPPGSAGSYRESTVTAPLVEAGRAVGLVLLTSGSDPWLSMDVRSGLGDQTVTCVVRERDGHMVRIGTFVLSDGRGYWAVSLAGASSPVRAVSLLDASGVTVASAALPT